MRKAVSAFLGSLLCASNGFAAQLFFEYSNGNPRISLDNFLALSCDPTGNRCAAVGRDDRLEDPSLLVYRSEDGGLNWGTPVSLAKAPKSESPDLNLATDIKCDAAFQRCFIISSTRIGGIPSLVVYKTLENGLIWSEPTVLPLPKSKFKKDGSYLYARLSCSYSAVACAIAGTLRAGDESLPLIYTTENEGSDWILGPALRKPARTRSNGISLYDVHCDHSGASCKAVGYALTRNAILSDYSTSKPVVYLTKDGGGHWSNPIMLPSDVDKDKKASTLTLVKCDRTGLQCITLGETYDYSTETSRFFSFTSANGGTTWENKQWINSGYSNEVFNAFDCDNAMKNCMAVGYSSKRFMPGRTIRALFYTTSNYAQTWEKDTSQSFPVLSYLRDVFCSDYNERCLALGIQEQSTPMIASPQAIQQTLNANSLGEYGLRPPISPVLLD